MLVSPQERLTPRLILSPCVDYIVSEIEIIRNLYLEIPYKILISVEIRMFKKSFYHYQLH